MTFTANIAAFARRIVALGLIALVLGAASPGAAGASPLNLPDDPAAGWVLRVRVRNAADVRRLVASGLDVLEARSGRYVLALGAMADVSRLRAEGFEVELVRNLGDPQVPQPFAGGYRTVAEHEAHLDAVAAAHPDLAVVVDYGDAWRKANGLDGGHDLKALCLTRRRPGDCALDPQTDKPRFLMIAAIHARELTPSEMAWRWIDELAGGYGVDPEVTWLLDAHEVWVVPVANPDGRHIVESAYLYHRKNANTDFCPHQNPGVDLNRNAGFAWGVSGVSSEPCDDNYLGPAPASEPEQAALEELMRRLFPDQRGPALTDAAPVTATGIMLTLHSFSDLVLLPWGWTECSNQACPPDQRAPNDVALRSLAFRMSHFNGYAVGQASELLYAASGTTDDWAYGVLGIPGFTFEIGSAYGECGFFDPPYACQDEVFWPLNRGAFLYAAKVARQPYALAQGPSVLSVTLALSGTAVIVTALADDGLYGATGIGRPVAQAISQAELYIDAPPWAGGQPIPMAARDGVYDSSAERIYAVLEPHHVGLGRHLLFVRARDGDGHWGPVTATWHNALLLPLGHR